MVATTREECNDSDRALNMQQSATVVRITYLELLVVFTVASTNDLVAGTLRGASVGT